MSEQELQREFLATFGVPGDQSCLEALSKAALWREMPLHGLRQAGEGDSEACVRLGVPSETAEGLGRARGGLGAAIM